MSTRLRVDYMAVEGLVSDMKTYEASIETTYTDMKTTVESLVNNGYMEAEAANAYVNEFTEMLGPDVEKLAELIGKFSTQLTQICENFAEADAAIASMLF